VSDATIGGFSDRFGYEWTTYKKIPPEHGEQFRRWPPFCSPEDWRGSRFIDVGCGMGRNSFWPMTYGAMGGAAVDLDDRTLDAARANCCHTLASKLANVVLMNCLGAMNSRSPSQSA
jgi:SAM-dependent methyltransferase